MHTRIPGGGSLQHKAQGLPQGTASQSASQHKRRLGSPWVTQHFNKVKYVLQQKLPSTRYYYNWNVSCQVGTHIKRCRLAKAKAFWRGLRWSRGWLFVPSHQNAKILRLFYAWSVACTNSMAGSRIDKESTIGYHGTECIQSTNRPY